MNQTRCTSHSHIPRIIILNRHKHPRLQSILSIMASGGMAELRAAEQKAAQIVQEARAGKAKCLVEGTRAVSSVYVDSRPFCFVGIQFVIRHGYTQSWSASVAHKPAGIVVLMGCLL